MEYNFQTKFGSMIINYDCDKITRLTFINEKPKSNTKETPPSFVLDAVIAIQKMLEGHNEHKNLLKLPLDFSNFTKNQIKVLKEVRKIPFGKTSTYGEIATKINMNGGSRFVGQVMSQNPYLLIIPCHRIIRSDGKLGGFSAPRGITLKQELLKNESQEKGSL